MKKTGSIFEYEDERNEDLMQAYRFQMSSCRTISMREIYLRVVNMPSKRFWVSEERASIIISQMLKGDRLEKMRPLKREMFQEIYHRVLELRRKAPDACLYELTSQAVSSPAPKFYLTPSSAKVMILKIKRQWYEERKRKYRHLFM